MSLQTTKRGIAIAKEMFRNGNGDKPILILSTSRPVFWEKEAELKKEMVLEVEAGLDLNDVIIIPGMEDSFDEAAEIKKIISTQLGAHKVSLIITAERWHAFRVERSLRMVLPSWIDIKTIKVKAKIERHLDTSWLRSFLCSSTTLNYILWQWFFGLIGPLMSRRQKKKRPAT